LPPGPVAETRCSAYRLGRDGSTPFTKRTVAVMTSPAQDRCWCYPPAVATPRSRERNVPARLLSGRLVEERHEPHPAPTT
jgi:hypothetical protein